MSSHIGPIIDGFADRPAEKAAEELKEILDDNSKPKSMPVPTWKPELDIRWVGEAKPATES
jgi:hypothetical protein